MPAAALAGVETKPERRLRYSMLMLLKPQRAQLQAMLPWNDTSVSSWLEEESQVTHAAVGTCLAELCIREMFVSARISQFVRSEGHY